LVIFGLADDHFGNSSVDGDFGIQQAGFWLLKSGEMLISIHQILLAVMEMLQKHIREHFRLNSPFMVVGNIQGVEAFPITNRLIII
jgi:hypothetical protein